MDRTTTRLLTAELNTVLTTWAATKGLSYTPGNVRFTDAHFEVKASFAERAADGSDARVAKEWLAYAPLFGLPADALGRDITMANGHRYRITGIKPTSRRYPVLGTRPDGKTFKLPAEAVRQALGVKAPALTPVAEANRFMR